MKFSYICFFTAISCSIFIQGMEEVVSVRLESSQAIYSTPLDEGYGVIQRFFSNRKNSLCLESDTMDPQELLVLVIRNPEEECNREVTFEEFQQFYQGVGKALKEIDFNSVHESKSHLLDLLLSACTEAAQATSYKDLLATTANPLWARQSPFDKGLGTARRFFAVRRNLSNPRQLLAGSLYNPVQEQKKGVLSYEEFKAYYKGVETALNQVQYNAIRANQKGLVSQLLLSCSTIAQAHSYEELLAATRNSHWHICVDALEETLSTCSIVHSEQPGMGLNHETIQSVIAHESGLALYDTIHELDLALSTGNITSADIEWLLPLANQLLAIPLESFDVNQADISHVEEHSNYQRALIRFTKKVIALKESPTALYLEAHEQALSNNNAQLAAQHFTECLLATRSLAEGGDVSEEAIESFTYCKSFFEGINISLTHHPKTLGRICALQKLADFIKCLPPEFMLLGHKKEDPSKTNHDALAALVYSQELFEHVQRIVHEMQQFDGTLLAKF